MHNYKDYIRAGLMFIALMSFLSGFLVLNGLHHAGVL
jgi:hypothetical protein